jgi:hypothetical protein
MRSFRLYLGERRYLTATEWASLLVAVAVIGAVGYFGAAWLANLIGPGEPMLWLVAGTGLVTWGACWIAFRALGFPLIAEIPADENRSHPPRSPWKKQKP